MTCFVDRINKANQSIDRNKKLPANLARKSHCDTMEAIKAKLSDAVVQCTMAAKDDGLQKLDEGGIMRSVNDNS